MHALYFSADSVQGLADGALEGLFYLKGPDAGHLPTAAARSAAFAKGWQGPRVACVAHFAPLIALAQEAGEPTEVLILDLPRHEVVALTPAQDRSTANVKAFFDGRPSDVVLAQMALRRCDLRELALQVVERHLTVGLEALTLKHRTPADGLDLLQRLLAVEALVAMPLTVEAAVTHATVA
jgi:hypothetical protein